MLDQYLQQRVAEGRPIGIVFEHYSIYIDEMIKVQVFIEPDDIAVFDKYFTIIKQEDYRSEP